MILVVFLLVLIYYFFQQFYLGGHRDFINIYSKIPLKHISKLSYTHFAGLYIINNDSTNTLPVWKVDAAGYSYVWNAGYYFLPFARFHYSRTHINELFVGLTQFKATFENTPYKLERLPHRLTIYNQFVLFCYEHVAAPVVDYFQEEVRMMCKRRGKESHWSIYNKMKKPGPKEPLNFNLKLYNQIHDDLWRESYSCTEIDPEITIGVINWLNAHDYSTRQVLDMSAGRGSRMIACIASPRVFSYTGVDPNSLSHEWYETQARYFCDVYNNKKIFNGNKRAENFKVLRGGFVETDLPEKEYDLMFSSPPYFDLEVYSDDKEQSVAKNSSIESWIKNFMFASMTKIIQHLRPGGIMAININLSRVYKDDWVSPLISFNDGCEYLGCLSSYRKDTNFVQPIWLWKKRDLIFDRKPFGGLFDSFNVRHINISSLTEIKKYVGKKKNTITFINIVSPLENVKKYPIWKYINGIATIIINNTCQLIPLAVLNVPFPEYKREGCKWSVIKQEWEKPFDIDEKFLSINGEPIIIKVASGQINDLEYFVNKITVQCSVKYTRTPWNLFIEKKIPKFNNYKDLDYWYYNNRILCLVSSDSVYIATIEFIKSLGHSCNNVYLPEIDPSAAIVNAFMYVGCKYLYVRNHNTEHHELTITLLNCLTHGVEKWDSSLSNPRTKFDLIYLLPVHYGITDRGEDSDPSNKFKRFDVWIQYLIDEINSYCSIAIAGGLIVLQIQAYALRDRGEQLLTSIKHKLLGGFVSYRNTLIHTWVWRV